MITGLYPLGVTAGETARWKISGRRLDGITRLRFSGDGLAVVEQPEPAEGEVVVSVRASETAAPGIRELRVEGPSGLSNLVLFRVDTLRTVDESEPNDRHRDASDMPLNATANGRLETRDVDSFRIRGVAGRPLTVEVETRRLGALLAPVVTLLDLDGRALAQGRQSPGLGGDCRLTSTFPTGGAIVVQVHDALYQSGEGASYRLRVFDTPFATAIFPLGGRRGETVEVIASGGTLDRPRQQRIELPDRAGAVVALKPFEGQERPLEVARRIIVGDGLEVREEVREVNSKGLPRLERGTTVNGSIDKPHEVDRYRVLVRRGESLRVVVQAAALGSWLDSVLTLRNGQGEPIAENDDHTDDAAGHALLEMLDGDAAATDSQLVQRAEADGEWQVEVTDRYGKGGPEYAYRLWVEPDRPDFRVEFAPPRPEPGSDGVLGPEGVLNLRPGSTHRVPLRVIVDGRTGPIVLRSAGLPSGVVAEPVTVRPLGERGLGSGTGDGGKSRLATLRAELRLVVAEEAPPGVGELRVVGTTRLARGGGTVARTARMGLPIYRWGGAPPRTPLVWNLVAIPIKILARPGKRIEASISPH